MADGVRLNSGGGGDLIAADEVGSSKYQIVKIAFGADGTATNVTTTDAFPVDLPGVTSSNPLSVTVTSDPDYQLTESTLVKIRVQDLDVRDLLKEILRQMTIANAQLASMTEDQYDTEINEDPTEEI